MTAPTNTTLQQPSQLPLERLQGVVERVTCHDENAGTRPRFITLNKRWLTASPRCSRRRWRWICRAWDAGSMGIRRRRASPSQRRSDRRWNWRQHHVSSFSPAGQDAARLAFDPKTMQFRHNEQNPLPVQAIVIDEASMLDRFLAHSLVKAIPKDAQVLIVGDSDQLPSVGPGMVLRDLIASEQLPVVRLTEVFRQAAESHIVTNAHRINAGQFPQLTPTTKFAASDCLWLEAPEPDVGAEGIRHLVSEYLPNHGIDPVTQVQVLSPTTRGEVGTRQLNFLLQQMLNPATPQKTELARGGSILRVGDRVIQQVNDYQREVFNGDLGTIVRIDLEEQEVTVQFAGRAVTYDYANLSELSLAWAITIYKAQGSEYPVVILPIFMQHFVLLSRNLLYTGLTRAKERAILVGPTKTIGFTTRRVLDRQRYTQLAERLKQTVACD